MAKVKTSDVEQARIKSELEQTLKSADPERSAGLLKLRRLRSVKGAQQAREQQRLSGRLGSEHPRVKALQGKINTSKAVVHTLKYEAVRAATEVPSVGRQDWLVYGRVMDRQQEPVAGLKTALYDGSGCPLQTCGSDITDKTGYFSLTIKQCADNSANLAAADEAALDVELAAPAAREEFVAYLYVLDSNHVTLHRDKRPLSVAPGRVHYLEVVLDDSALDRPPKDNTEHPPEPSR